MSGVHYNGDRRNAASELEIRRHLERFMPPVGSEPHVWIAPVNARADEHEKWLDVGPLNAVCRAYPEAGKILRKWLPGDHLDLGGILNLTPDLRCRISLIGEAKRG